MVQGVYVAPPQSVFEELPTRLKRDFAVAELRQAFSNELEGRDATIPTRLALVLLAEGYTPHTVRWLLREAAVAACVAAI
jgi:hypothetical protein